MRPIKIPVGVKLFIAIWIAALCVPTMHSVIYALKIVSELSANAVEVDDSVPNELLRGFPNEPIVVGWAAENSFYGNERNVMKEAFARFPNDLPLRALRVKTTAYDMPHADKKRNGKDAFHKAEFAKSAQIAHEGGKEEPDNAFWPWMEAAFEFSIGQDDAALKAFERIQHCTRFDDYGQQSVKARLEFWEKHGDPSFEQKLRQLFFSQLFPHLTALRESGDLASERAGQLRKGGDNAHAMAVENGVLNAMRLVRRDGSSIIFVLLGESGARDSLGRFFSIAKPKESGNYVDPTIYGAKLARAWDFYTRKNGRPELADNTNFVNEISGSRDWGEYISNMSFAQFGFHEPWGIIATIGPVALLVLGVVIWFGAIAWAPTTLLRGSEPMPSRGQVMACANFSFWLLLGICVVLVADFSLVLNPFISSEMSVKVTWILINFFSLTLFCWLLPVWFINMKRGRHWTRIKTEHPRVLGVGWNRARKIAWVVGIVGALLVYSNGYGLWDDTPFQFPIALGAMILGLSLALSLELARWNLAGTRIHWRASGKRSTPTSFLRWAPWLLWGLALFGVGALINGISEGAILFDQIMRALLTLLAFVGALFMSWRAARDHFGWQLAHGTLGTLVLMWSVVFLLLSIGLIPLRAQLNRNLDRQIKIGEIAWMREQIAKPK